MLKIQRFVEGKLVVFALSGRIEEQNLGQLELLVKAEPESITVDLKEVDLAGRDAVAFLARCEASGATLKNCPAYIVDWIARERAAK